MSDIHAGLARWGLDVHQVRERLYRAPTPRERERWHALWRLAQGWPATQVATLPARDQHTLGIWLAGCCNRGPDALVFEQAGGSPPVLATWPIRVRELAPWGP